MPDVVGVRFKRASPVYYFDPSGLPLEINDNVIVETSKGLALGRVVIAPKQVLANEITEPLKPVVRKATPEDFQKIDELVGEEQGALARCEEAIKQFNLPMKLLRAEYNADGTRLTVFFSSEQRVDFRELLKKLTGTLRTRVELRQVGARDEAKLIGGQGRCGRPLCCANHLCSFESVSVKLAKEQNLPLNPTKISGLCGKLLCCLGYESCFYRSMKEVMPKLGQRVSTPSGEGKAVQTNALKETVVVELDNETTVELPVAQVTRKAEQQGPPQPRQIAPQAEITPPRDSGRGRPSNGGGPRQPQQGRQGGNQGQRGGGRNPERARQPNRGENPQRREAQQPAVPQQVPDKPAGASIPPVIEGPGGVE